VTARCSVMEFGVKSLVLLLKYPFMKSLLLAIPFLALVVLSNGCEVDGFIDPSKTGYFEHTPTSMPILNRIDIIERESGFQPDTTKPTPEDLVPNDLQYRLAPGDVVRVEIYELVVANQTDVSVRVIDQSGVIRLPTLGDMPAAGLTVQELQDQIVSKLKDLIGDPLVTVVLEDGRSFQFTIYGAVSGTGIYALTRPDFRLMDAVSLAGGTAATTQRVLVIREVALNDSVNPSYLRKNDSKDTKEPPETIDVKDIDALIKQLEQGNQPSPAARGQSSDPPVDVDDLSETPSPTPAAGDEKAVASTSTKPASSKFVFDENLQEWVRKDGAEDQGKAASTNKKSTGGDQTAEAVGDAFATRIIEVDYQALARGDSNLNIVVRPSDRIYVDTPEIGVVYVDGEVSRPGVYQMPIAGKLTLSRLVAAAGGLNPIAIPERVDLVRKIAPDRESALRVNLAAIRNRAEPDIYMRKDDHVIVGTNFWASPLAVVRNGFRMTYGFGFLLDRNFGNDVFGPPPVNFVGQ
jgi:polysaccharide export outer membrane protein